MSLKNIKKVIIEIILCLVAVALMLWKFIEVGILTKDNWIAVVCFYSCFIILIFAMTEITSSMLSNSIVVRGVRYDFFMLFERNRNILHDFQDFCVTKRKNAIIRELALIRMYCGEEYDENFCLERFDNNDKEYFFKLIKRCKIKDKQDYKAKIKEYFATKSLPCEFYHFENYYSGQMLQTKNTIGGILVSTFSIVLAVLSLISIDALKTVNIDFWFIVFASLISEICESIITWKSKKRELVSFLETEYKRVQNNLNEFYVSIRQSTRN